MEWLLWSGLLLLVIGWPVLLVIMAVVRRSVFSSRRAESPRERTRDART